MNIESKIYNVMNNPFLNVLDKNSFYMKVNKISLNPFWHWFGDGIAYFSE